MACVLLAMVYVKGQYYTGLISLLEEAKRFTHSFARPDTGSAYIVRPPGVVLQDHTPAPLETEPGSPESRGELYASVGRSLRLAKHAGNGQAAELLEKARVLAFNTRNATGVLKGMPPT